jgi:DNA-binding CsgD family transcriptional regulator/tetratricopeptide (TPR) repeat protein
VLRHAPAAAQRASSTGAHREAAAHYAQALRHGDGLPARELARLLERSSYESYLIDRYDDSIEALERAGRIYRELGDTRAEGEALRMLAERLWCPGRVAEAEQVAHRALALHAAHPPGRELAKAYGTLAKLYGNGDDAAQANAWGARAIELAERDDDVEVLVDALTSIGTVEFLIGAPEGRERLERSIELASEAGRDTDVARALVNLATVSMRHRACEETDRYVEAGLEFCRERGLDLMVFYLDAIRARSMLDRGRWAEAAEHAMQSLRHPRSSTVPQIIVLVVLGLARGRRGDRGAEGPIEQAQALAERSGELSGIAPVAAARAELALLAGNHAAVAEATDDALELALRLGAPWDVGELACWRGRAGIRETFPIRLPEPFALQLAGAWERSAEVWAQMGCPYQSALALADSDDEDALREALREFHAMETTPAAAIVARRLRERGARGLPRGPRRTTQRNPSNLTVRELEVLELLVAGLSNASIADRLVVSPRTVDHHVSSILRKLDVPSRGAASAEAARLGLTKVR